MRFLCAQWKANHFDDAIKNLERMVEECNGLRPPRPPKRNTWWVRWFLERTPAKVKVPEIKFDSPPEEDKGAFPLEPELDMSVVDFPMTPAMAILRAPKGFVGRPMTWVLYDKDAPSKRDIKGKPEQAEVEVKQHIKVEEPRVTAEVETRVEDAAKAAEHISIEEPTSVGEHISMREPSLEVIDLTVADDEDEILFSTEEHDYDDDFTHEGDVSLPSVWSQDSADSDWTITQCQLLQQIDTYHSPLLSNPIASLADILQLASSATTSQPEVDICDTVGNDTTFVIDEDIDTPVLVPFCIGEDDDEDEDFLPTPLVRHASSCASTVASAPYVEVSDMGVPDPEVPSIEIVDEDDEDCEYAATAKSFFDDDDDDDIRREFIFPVWSRTRSNIVSYLLRSSCSLISNGVCLSLSCLPLQEQVLEHHQHRIISAHTLPCSPIPLLPMGSPAGLA